MMTPTTLAKLKEKGLIRDYDLKGADMPVNKPAKPNKYRNNKIVRDGVKWDSIKEYKRYKELELLQRAGEITYLARQVVFVLSVCKYVADFTYYDKTGHYTVEDVKSAHTRKLPVYRLKKKLMQKERNITIKEV